MLDSQSADALRLQRSNDAEMQITKIRIRQMKDRAAAKPLSRKVKDRERADLRHRPSLYLASRNRDRSNEVLSYHFELEIAIFRCGHRRIKDRLPSTRAQIEGSDCLFRSSRGCGRGLDEVRCLDAITV